MELSRRQRLISELQKLHPDDFDSLVNEVREHHAAQEAGVATLAALFEAKRSPLAGFFGSGSGDE
jgi:hypothetical protein